MCVCNKMEKCSRQMAENGRRRKNASKFQPREIGTNAMKIKTTKQKRENEYWRGDDCNKCALIDA